MVKQVLVFNAGSSSLKFAFFRGSKKVIFGKCDRVGSSKSHLVINDYEKVFDVKIKSFRDAVEIVEGVFGERGFIFDVIGHRVVHGGNLKKTSKINFRIERVIKKYSEFAPLHNIPELEVIRICKKFRKPQYAVFDTAFFEGLPEVAKAYPIPKKILKKYKIRRYGFHGISHKYVSKGLKGKTITCHLGNGASVSAILKGKPIDTSMGLTPLEGLMMGSRAGDLDPGLVVFLEKRGVNLNRVLNKESGFKGLVGKTDIREIMKMNNKSSELALEIFVYKIVEYIGSYIAALEGLDNLVFTGGIGENIPLIRKKICDSFGFIGLKIDKVKNRKNLEVISDKKSKVKVLVKKTDEEKIIAKEVLRYNEK